MQRDNGPGQWQDVGASLPRADEPGWSRLTETEKQFVAMAVIEGMVTNGGFHAVYYNDCAGYMPLALAGYEAIGATRQANIVASVIEMIEADPWSGPPETWPDPDAAPEGSGDIGEFEDAWYEFDLPGLRDRRIEFCRTHKADFPNAVE